MCLIVNVGVNVDFKGYLWSRKKIVNQILFRKKNTNRKCALIFKCKGQKLLNKNLNRLCGKNDEGDFIK